uniref:YjeF N-terminal domain-containing protein n=1 Tax=Timspurckia oligopyrenoides TaxID=708627 RepID=A0A7S1ETJ5_9RHOD|mmetsp:Transcript_761/g.1390  ORF Transcript_761/g.1390 Transcript_761/m.1390 type:complete len:349 (+) Transcript_761:72-1118(+)
MYATCRLSQSVQLLFINPNCSFQTHSHKLFQQQACKNNTSNTKSRSYFSITLKSDFNNQTRHTWTRLSSTQYRKILSSFDLLSSHHYQSDCANGLIDVLSSTFGINDKSSPAHRNQPSNTPRVLVLCGPGFSGHVVLQAAAQLAARGASITLVMLDLVCEWPSTLNKKRERNQKLNLLLDLCRCSGVQVINFFPSTFAFYFDLVIDALDQFDVPIHMISDTRMSICDRLKNVKLPVVSIDAPCGWNLDGNCSKNGTDMKKLQRVDPKVLVSLGIAKEYSIEFEGSFHFLVGKEFQQKICRELCIQKDALRLPGFPLNSSCVLLEANTRDFGWGQEPDEHTPSSSSIQE